MLKITTDPAQRRVIEKLLLDEEAKLKKHEEDHKKNKSLPHVLDQRWLLSASACGSSQRSSTLRAWTKTKHRDVLRRVIGS
jgi:hypothetical protein